MMRETFSNEPARAGTAAISCCNSARTFGLGMNQSPRFAVRAHQAVPVHSLHELSITSIMPPCC
jgi:hypothetical protein